MRKSILIFVNPVSGKRNGLSLAKALSDEANNAGIDSLILESSINNEVNFQMLRSINLASYFAMVAIGGDGLAHYAVQVLTGKTLPIYVVPAGTGNDFARSNRTLLFDSKYIVKQIIERSPQQIDVGNIIFGSEQRKFVQILSTGFDANVNDRANRNRFISGKLKYTLATLLELPKFRAVDYEIEYDGVKRCFPAMLIAIANGRTYGGGMQLCPMAVRDDGLFDVMILHPVSKFELLKVFPKVFSGSHVNHPAVEFVTARKVQISANTVAYADGERVGKLPITVEVLPKSLQTWIAN